VNCKPGIYIRTTSPPIQSLTYNPINLPRTHEITSLQCATNSSSATIAAPTPQTTVTSTSTAVSHPSQTAASHAPNPTAVCEQTSYFPLPGGTEFVRMRDVVRMRDIKWLLLRREGGRLRGSVFGRRCTGLVIPLRSGNVGGG
jgi:hypothetical protein